MLKNSRDQYGIIAILLHWMMAIIMIGLLALGLYMTRLPVSLEKLKLFGWHKSYGMLVLCLAFLRLGWRLVNLVPDLPSAIPVWQKFAARTVHFAFYIFMFAMPITGWLVTSAAGLPVSFFGWVTLPNLISPDEHLRIVFSNIHQWLGYALIATICAHVGAALKHHFINKDDVMRRMLSW